ncbi:hypothetical protein [Thalassospira marina]|uniref:Uncharacterized protein n=1 Tax=Thalassospira marina TaxID=2048283 RepID=A0ABM6Q6H9_9PROT|nr:hypothetical protein [Thalassospira marina]AUG52149.1 hypothetical protein CSC3H3_04980 [Thalassospira marina]
MEKSFLLFLTLAAFTTGGVIGASLDEGLLKNLLHQTKITEITEIISSLSTFLGVIFAFYTYHRWMEGKKKDDAYLAAKKYLSCFDEIEDILHEMTFQYNHMCPAPGVPEESRDCSEQRINKLTISWDFLYHSMMNLRKSNRYLNFWSVTLKEKFKKDHTEICDLTSDILSITKILNSQIINLINNRENVKEITLSKRIYDEKCRKIHKINEIHKNSKFNDFFEFKK